MKIRFPLLLLLLGAGGCGPTVAGPSLGRANIVIPPVRAGTSPPRWEYVCFKDHRLVSIAQKSNALGNAGFELSATAVSPSSGSGTAIWCFKRRLP